VQGKRVFCRDKKVFWKCRVCGQIIEAATAPDKCPVCDHPQEYFEVWVENY